MEAVAVTEWFVGNYVADPLKVFPHKPFVGLL